MKNLSKQLSYVLRHRPDSIGISLDSSGWVEVSILLEKLGIKMDTLEQVVNNNDKKRFAFNEDKTKIRASQGHSVNIDLGLKSLKPPITLYHGTATKNLDSILKKGLIKGNRQYVHLSNNTKTAAEVGKRYGTPYIIPIKAALMHIDGYKFYQSENGVWLTDHVPTFYFDITF